MGVRSGLRGCLRRCAGKSSSDGNVPTVWEAGNTDHRVFQICSSDAFGLASSPVSLEAVPAEESLVAGRNESTTISESLCAVEHFPGKEKPRISPLLDGSQMICPKCLGRGMEMEFDVVSHA